MRKILYILTIFLLACGKPANKNDFSKTNHWLTPYILDSLQTTIKDYEATKMRVPNNDIDYLGPLSDTVNINKFSFYDYESYLDYHGFQDSIIVNEKLKIIISPKQLLTIGLKDNSIPPPPALINSNEDFNFDSIKTTKSLKQREEIRREYFQAIPIYIFNPTKDTLYLDQQDGRVIMIQEAKNEKGEWKPIEYWEYSACGNSYGTVMLLPKNFALIKGIKYSGSFETELRFKMRNGNTVLYSDNFKGNINKSQFDLPTDYIEKFLANKSYEKIFLERIFLNR
ncbi:hypothetical protein ACE01N_20505 [Saccharicrinis sp. FJH2]|uniref:hypothetical protein n=1 Tax=Saccharicrinis sp. FJH65 TaxID=3344659 RepID=UPI0035F38236